METTVDEQEKKANLPTCKTLWDICTPDLYRKNPFRIVGIHADAGAREIKRRICEIRDALEFGDSSSEFSYAYAPFPLPDLGEIQEASRQFDDPEIRVAYEFFWFWPKEWGAGKSDPAIAALMAGDSNTALEHWKSWAEGGDEDSRIVARHNIAISYHLWLLDQETKTIGAQLDEAEYTLLDNKWRESFEWWEELADSEAFWSRVSARIRMLEDPRLTTGFSRRMRATFPEAFDRINALIAIRHIEANLYPRAELHIEYMDMTHADLDDVPQTLSDVAEPLKKKIRKAINRVEVMSEGRRKVPTQDILDLIAATERPRAILAKLAKKLPGEDEDVGDFADRISEICRSATIKAGNQDEDWDTSLLLINHGIELAHSEEQKNKCKEDKTVAAKLKKQDHPIAREIGKTLEAADKESNYIKRVAFLNQKAAPLLDSLGEKAGRKSDPFSFMRDQIAFALRECGIGLFNLNIKELNEGFERAMEMQNRGIPGANYLPVGRAAMIWFSAELLQAVDALAVGDKLREKLKDDHDALDSIRKTIDTLVGRSVLDLSSNKGEWRAAGALPLPWASIAEKGQPKPPPVPRPSTSAGGNTSTTSSGCFIATAVYNSYDHPQVLVLREFRDRVLFPRLWGRMFIQMYYKVGPLIAPHVAKSSRWKPFCRNILDHLVAHIKLRYSKNVEGH